ncbi:MAG: pyruvate kinase [Proteobacteria bacterium]|nr:pyruvate kinase [Pseudomonadota bacterium]
MSNSFSLHDNLLSFRRTKIIATQGPASSSPEVLDELIAAGVDVFRLNFSHGTHESHAESFRQIKAAIARSGRHVAVLGDLCGPKIRVGHFEDGPIELIEGTQVTITVRKVPGHIGLIPSEYEHLAKDVKPGDRILMADGTRELRVESIHDETEILCTVIRGGQLSDRKGINLPNVEISTPSFTDKDKDDAAFACELGVDYLAISFVRTAKDVLELKEFIAARGADIPVMAKIEKPEAVQNIEDILNVSDAIMIARGDLGVEMAAEEIPLIQKELTRMAICANKPVVVATQMLESMISAGSPTRAEVTDVAWAAMAGADAVMLSGETSVGKYPVAAVKTMNRIVRMIEGYQNHMDRFMSIVSHEHLADYEESMNSQILEGLSRSTAKMARELNAKAIAVCAKTGTTARMVSEERPHAPIIGMSTEKSICARMSLYWGVLPVLVDDDVIRAPWNHVSEILKNTHLYDNSKDAGRYVVLVTLRDYAMALTPSLKILVD